MKWYEILGIVLLAIVLLVIAVIIYWKKHPQKMYLTYIHPTYTRKKRHSYQLLATEENKNKIVFLGDSITDMYALGDYFPQKPLINMGIAGDSTHLLYDRLSDVVALDPKLIVLLIGINDFYNENRKVDDVIKDYRKIVDKIHESLPSTLVILESLYPVSDKKLKLAQYKDSITEVNSAIKNVAKEYGYTYLDVFSNFVGTNGLAKDEYSLDGCHINQDGYKIVTEMLEPYIEGAL